MPHAAAHGIQIEYDTFGDSSTPALLLIMGGGSQMIYWEVEFCNLLAGKGLFVIRFDNRDIGLSTKFDHAGVPDMMAAMKGEPVSPAYTLLDMAFKIDMGKEKKYEHCNLYLRSSRGIRFLRPIRGFLDCIED